MSQDSLPEERTEMPTDKRMGELKKEGTIHMSNELPKVATLIAGFGILYLTWSWVFSATKQLYIDSFRQIASVREIDSNYLSNMSYYILKEFGPPMAIIMLTVAATSILSVMLQTGWNVKDKWVKVKFDSLNPINGVKKLFSINQVVSTLKAILQLTFILPIAYFSLKDYAPKMVNLIHLSIPEILEYMGVSCWDLFWKIMYVLMFFAVFDFFWTKYQWLKQNKMTKDEVKDEKKATDGDEKTKMEIKRKGLKRIADRIFQSVEQADVVVTNPTHYAVALKYDRSEMQAPRVVAKGRGFLALRIRKFAKQSNVPVLERKLLARALYSSVDVGRDIPMELFKAVAEVLAYVYRLKKPRNFKQDNAN